MTHVTPSWQQHAARSFCYALRFFSFLLLMLAAGRSQAACGVYPYMTFSDSCTFFNFKGAYFYDSSAGPAPSPSCLAYSWTFGDGSTATGANVSHTYASTGSYTVCLIIKNTCKGCSDTVCQTISTVCPTPCEHMPTGWRQVDSCSTIDFQGKDPSRPRTGPYKDPCLVYSWTFGDGYTAKGKNVRHEYAATGTYTVCMNVKDTCKGCDTTICKSVTVSCLSNCSGITKNWTFVDSCPTFYFEGGNPDASAGMDTRYRDSCLMYFWNFGDGSSGTGRRATHTYTRNGTYYASLRVWDTCRGCDTTIVKRITVSCLKSCDLPLGRSYIDSCNTVLFRGINDSMATPCIVRGWSFGDSTYSYGDEVVHTYADTGIYEV
ncbi:MAG: PKD domain-containing protein, partial [Chitinophagaceae bacterium]|nr:PKD domain-containing protein [Chitinophagaceae bacterium]